MMLDTKDFNGPDLADRWGMIEYALKESRDPRLVGLNRILTNSDGPMITSEDETGAQQTGHNFANMDFLGLGRHPRVQDAATEAIGQHGTSTGRLTASGGVVQSVALLERRIADYLHYSEAVLFSSCDTALNRAVSTLVRGGDVVFLEETMKSDLPAGTIPKSARTELCSHTQISALSKRLRQVRTKNPDIGLHVITRTLFEADGVSAELARLQSLCDRYRATLIVVAGYDLGTLGATGRGLLEVQDMLGSVDIFVGSLAPAFGVDCGFVAANHPSARMALRVGPATELRDVPIAPWQAAAALAAIDLSTSDEGQELRRTLDANVALLRAELQAAGPALVPSPGPVVTANIGHGASGRYITTMMLGQGHHFGIGKRPGAAGDILQWHLAVTALHEADGIRAFARELAAYR